MGNKMTIYTNFDHTFNDAVVAEAMKFPGEQYQHAAWNFCGYVHFDDETEEWVEEVWRYHVPVAEYRNKDLKKLIATVNGNHDHD